MSTGTAAICTLSADGDDGLRASVMTTATATQAAAIIATLRAMLRATDDDLPAATGVTATSSSGMPASK